MSTVPPPYTRQASFTAFQTEQAPTVGQGLEAEFNKVKQSQDATQARLAQVQRDDGLLRNLSVHPDALSEAVRALLGADAGIIRGPWVSGVAYSAKDVVSYADSSYIAVDHHVAGGDFLVDLDVGHWIVLARGSSATQLLSASVAAGDTLVSFNAFGLASSQITMVFHNGVFQEPSTWIGSDTGVTFNDPLPVDGTVVAMVANVPSNNISTGSIAFTQSGTGAVSRTASDKLRERLSVIDFGAVGDDATVNTTALQNAINAAIATGKELFVPAGTYRTGALTFSAPFQMIGEGIERTVFRYTPTSGVFLSPTAGVNPSYSLFQDFKVLGAGRDVAGDAVGFKFSEGVSINRSITFNRVWIEGFNLAGVRLADSIACAFRDVRLRSCGATGGGGGGPKGGGLLLYSLGVLTGSASAIELLMDNCTVSGCNYGVATGDTETLVFCSVRDSSLQSCNEGIRSIQTDDLLLFACYFESNVTMGAYLRNGFDIRTRAIGATNAITYSGTGISMTRDGLVVREGANIMFDANHASDGVATLVARSGAIRVLNTGAALSAAGPGFYSDNGSPEGVVFAPAGSIYLRRDGGNSTGIVYVKRTSSGSNTGWRTLQRVESGATGSRPATPEDIGTFYFDTTLGKPVWWNGTVWKDAAGTTV